MSNPLLCLSMNLIKMGVGRKVIEENFYSLLLTRNCFPPLLLAPAVGRDWRMRPLSLPAARIGEGRTDVTLLPAYTLIHASSAS